MMRIALLGNSHLYSWKRAWNSLGRAYPDVDLVFFAARGAQLECCEPQGDRLVFKREDIARWIEVTSGGRRELVAADYDALCVVGLGCGVRAVTALYPRWRADSHQGDQGRFQLVSDACFQDTVVDRLNASPAMVLVGKLRQITDKVIWLAPAAAWKRRGRTGRPPSWSHSVRGSGRRESPPTSRAWRRRSRRRRRSRAARRWQPLERRCAGLRRRRRLGRTDLRDGISTA